MSSIIKVDTIQNQSGANIISESSNTITVGASGDTITVPSGATLGGAGTVDLSSATVTLNDSMKNTPSFRVGLSSAQTISNSSHTIIIFNSKQFDTDSAYDTSTGRFTVPSGKAGKYYFNAMYRFQSTSVTNLVMLIQKNGTNVVNMQHYDTGQYPSINASLFIDLTVGDYITVTAFQTSGADRDLTGNEAYTNFSGFKLIG